MLVKQYAKRLEISEADYAAILHQVQAYVQSNATKDPEIPTEE